MQPAPTTAHAAAPLVTTLPSPAFSVGGVIGKTFSTWTRNLVPFAVLAAVFNLPNFAYQLWNTYSVYGQYPSFQQMMKKAIERRSAGVSQWSLSGFVAETVMIALGFIELGAFTHGAIQHLSGRKPSIGALLGTGFRRAFPLCVAGAIGVLLVIGGTVLLVVPGVIAFCAGSVAIPIVAAEAKGPIEATRRSFALTRGYRFPIWLAFVVMTLAASAAGAFMGLIPMALGGGTASLVAALAGFVVSAITTPLWVLIPAIAYHDLRIAKEGVDTSELSRVFE